MFVDAVSIRDSRRDALISAIFPLYQSAGGHVGIGPTKRCLHRAGPHHLGYVPVSNTGVEPVACCVLSSRSTDELIGLVLGNLTGRGVYAPLTFPAPCGESGTRTPHLLLAKQTLYQMS